jgi:hypothetical protein
MRSQKQTVSGAKFVHLPTTVLERLCECGSASTDSVPPCAAVRRCNRIDLANSNPANLEVFWY